MQPENSGWQRETIFRMLKTFLLPEWQEEEVDRLENYVLSHGIRPWQYHEPWEFRTYRDLDAPAPALSEKNRPSSQRPMSGAPASLPCWTNWQKNGARAQSPKTAAASSTSG